MITFLVILKQTANQLSTHFRCERHVAMVVVITLNFKKEGRPSRWCVDATSRTVLAAGGSRMVVVQCGACHVGSADEEGEIKGNREKSRRAWWSVRGVGEDGQRERKQRHVRTDLLHLIVLCKQIY